VEAGLVATESVRSIKKQHMKVGVQVERRAACAREMVGFVWESLNAVAA